MPVQFLAHPVLRFAVHETGELQVLSAWFPQVAFDEAILAMVDGRRLTLRGDEITFRCANGGATYALGPMTDIGIRIGALLRSWAWSGLRPGS